jgi:hypothetical protein
MHATTGNDFLVVLIPPTSDVVEHHVCNALWEKPSALLHLSDQREEHCRLCALCPGTFPKGVRVRTDVPFEAVVLHLRGMKFNVFSIGSQQAWTNHKKTYE